MTINKLSIIMAAVLIALCSCRDRRAASTAGEYAMADTTVVVLPEQHLNCSIVEAVPGNFARVVFFNSVDRKTIVHDAEILSQKYERIDVCRPGATERGDHYLSFFENRVVDYETGEILLSETWAGL